MDYSHAMMVFLEVYFKVNDLKGDPSKLSAKEFERVLDDALHTTEEPLPETDADYYRLGCQYLLCKEAYDRAQEEYMREYALIYGGAQ